MTQLIMTRRGIVFALRRIISALPGGNTLLRMRSDFLLLRRFARIGDAKQVFRKHYEVNEWNSCESVSGPGSTIEYTENIRSKLPQLVNDLEAHVVLDAPCGDYNWFRMINWKTEIGYTGGDLVEPLVVRNQSLYGSKSKRFICLDITHDVLPRADLWLCRDCLFHLSNRDIMLALENFLNSDIRYLLTTTHFKCDRNYDIPTGGFRLLNLELPPFSFCKPMRTIDDWIEGFPARHLALWERKSLASSLASNRVFQRTVKRRR